MARQRTWDTYNRLRQLIYPDGETVIYAYDTGGLAASVSGKKGDYAYPYLEILVYDKFGQRVFMRQGNGVEIKKGNGFGGGHQKEGGDDDDGGPFILGSTVGQRIEGECG